MEDIADSCRCRSRTRDPLKQDLRGKMCNVVLVTHRCENKNCPTSFRTLRQNIVRCKPIGFLQLESALSAVTEASPEFVRVQMRTTWEFVIRAKRRCRGLRRRGRRRRGTRRVRRTRMSRDTAQSGGGALVNGDRGRPPERRLAARLQACI
jgi:hypothetical protein